MDYRPESRKKPSISSSGSDTSDVERWAKIYDKFHEIIRSEQYKCQSLMESRNDLLNLIDLKEEQWASRLRFLESTIEQMKTQEAKMKQYYASKMDAVIAVKDDQVSLYEKYANLTEKDWEDYNTCILSLCYEISDLKGKLEKAQTSNSQSASEKDPKSLTKLKHAYKTLKEDYKTLEKEKEEHISYLISEKDFSWNQFKKAENDYNALRKSRNIELDQANETVQNLQKNLEEMEGSISQKDDLIAELNGEVQSLKLLAKEKDEMILRLRLNGAELALGGASESVQTGTGRSLRPRTKRNLDESELEKEAFGEIFGESDDDLAGASKTVPKTGTKRKLETSSSGTKRMKGKDDDVAGASKTAPRTLRSRTKNTPVACSSGMRPCSSNSQGNDKIPWFYYLSNMKVPKVKTPSQMLNQ